MFEDRGHEDEPGFARRLAKSRDRRTDERVLGEAQPHGITAEGEVRPREEFAHPQDLRAGPRGGACEVDVVGHVRRPDVIEPIRQSL